MKVESQKQPDYLVFIVTGRYKLDEAIDKFPLAFASCRQTGYSKVLIDYRGLDGEIPATLNVLYGFGIVELYQEHRSAGGAPIKTAFVGNKLKSWSPAEEISRKHGLEAFSTSDYDTATAWLSAETGYHNS